MARFLFFFCFLSSIAFGTPKVCLNMIVKNESKVIERCLESVLPWIDYWVIVDTGSTDGTQKIIKKYLKKVPGELHERPWVGFGHNRQEAMMLAKGKGDYLLFIDADETLTGVLDKNTLTDAAYLAKIYTSIDPEITTQRALLINNHLTWTWNGVLHERLSCKENAVARFMTEMELIATYKDGCRSQTPDKYKKDADVLEKALVTDPNNETYVYYLAQSYFNAGEHASALKNYLKRAEMGGWDQEVFWSKYFSGVLQEMLGQNELFIKSYTSAFECRPTRAEPLYRISNYFLRNNWPVMSYVFSKTAIELPRPADITYIEDWIYSYGILLDLADSSYALGKWDESKAAYEEALSKKDLPEELRGIIKKKLAEGFKKAS